VSSTITSIDKDVIQVAISVQGRFHAFNLAQQMQQRGALAQLITTYPKYAAEAFGVPRSAVCSFTALEAFKRGWQRVPRKMRWGWNSQYFVHRSFDRFAARHLTTDADIFVGWSGSSLRTMRRAKESGMTTVIERGSSHMLYQQEVLREEYARAGLCFNETHPAVIDQELAEYEEADFLSIPSQFVKRTFLERGVPEEKLIHVPYGVDLSQFHRVAKEDDVFRVIQCGAVALRKGPQYLLQAFTELNLPNSELWLVGGVNDDMKPALAKYARSNVVVQGPKPQAELKWYYSQADVCCLMSVEEGLAMVQAQGMACARPLICTTNTGGEDLIRDGQDGFVVPIRDVEAIKEKLRWCYENRDACREMGQAARRRVEQGFTWHDYGERMMDAYQRIANNFTPSVACKVGGGIEGSNDR
jgi:glycosyltransferase involved in cell wall biosynthesis